MINNLKKCHRNLNKEYGIIQPDSECKIQEEAGANATGFWSSCEAKFPKWVNPNPEVTKKTIERKTRKDIDFFYIV